MSAAPKKIPPPDPFVRHPETEALIRILSAFERDELRDYGALSKEAGFDVKARWHYLASARKALGRSGYVFACLPGRGVRRLGDSNTVGHAAARTRRARSQARRSIDELSTVRLEQLDRDGLLLANALIAQGGAVLAVTGSGTQRRLMLAQKEQPKRLDAAEFADAVRDSMRRRLR